MKGKKVDSVGRRHKGLFVTISNKEEGSHIPK